ncbi:enhancer of polycomb-like-domain-containing protein [Fusarium flagelliforme]|uniref:enhancer of polycomb-like-domain-containing protein n=1 Tax=Fusarium flagelliforme TaxID=2675880 RepID=UPI001E8DD06B|nr:enhancer of polycomb-like-domain-containing protein [Fusarium flagelliforme]KAH7188509.1 enhancer of polycomb-like-domain-containing protein [Fusarium flagelliforme]
MPPASPTPRRPVTGRRRGRPPGSTNAARAARAAALAAASATEPPPKRRRYAPAGTRFLAGGAGGGGRYVTSDLLATPNTAGPSSRSRAAAREAINGPSPSLMPRRERGARTRAAGNDDLEEMQWGSAAAMATAVKQAEDYKPREERSWEDFHPNLNIEATFLVLRSEQVDGLPQEQPDTSATQMVTTPLDETRTPSRQPNPASTGNTPNPQGRSDSNTADALNETPLRRPRRPTRDVVSFYSSRPLDLMATPKTPKILPIQNQTPKEKLDLKMPSYRKTNRIELFESKTFGQARYVDKAMSNVGYQESDHYMRPDQTLIKSSDLHAEDDADLTDATSSEEPASHRRMGRVEYDMDEQDDMWLERLNTLRKEDQLEEITREIFEITMTKIEKEWHALEKRIPKPNPKPPQTHRPRSSSAAAVNGEPQGGEEPDSRCAICDDGDCENTNAIVFCDGCNLAVHQECYGVPFIPEGQWLCRKCLLCGRGVPTCIFCPNTDGAFKQTNSSKWAHLLCAMWIPEVSLGNHTFMEPVMDGALAVLDGGMVLKAFCDKHCPPDYAQEHNIHQATKAAKKFYKRTMRNRIWAENTVAANNIAARHRDALAEQPSGELQLAGNKNSASGDKKKGQPPKNLWKMPSGAPVIPQAVFEIVEASIQRFPFRKRKDFLSEACRYWTLKRQQRRGAALLKRLQLQMETFSSMELTRRDFAAMGPSGKARLNRRIDFAEDLIKELEQLKDLASQVVEREQIKVDAGELEQEFVDECYFPVAKLLNPAIDRAISLDKDLFTDGLNKLQTRINTRFYVTVMSFVIDLCNIISDGIATTPEPQPSTDIIQTEPHDTSLAKNTFSDIRERRKLGKRILKAVQPFLETALRVESEISQKPFESLQKELENTIDRSVEARRPQTATSLDKPIDPSDEANDTIMVDAELQITVKADSAEAGDAMDTTSDGGNIEVSTNIDVDTSELAKAEAGETQESLPNTVQSSDTPPDTDGYVSKPQPAQSGPPTPPQSNGSLGQEPSDPLTDGGVLWYFKGLDPQGTSVLEEQWAGRDAVRTLSEDLTDLDEEELKGLGMDVDNTAASATVEADVKEEPKTAPEPVGGKTRASKAKKRRTSTRRR